MSLPKWKRSGLCEAAQLSAPTTIHSASRWMFHWNVIPFFKSSTNVCGGVLFWLFGIKDELVCYVCVCMDVIATMVLLSSVVFSFFLLFIWMIFHLFFFVVVTWLSMHEPFYRNINSRQSHRVIWSEKQQQHSERRKNYEIKKDENSYNNEIKTGERERETHHTLSI